MNHQFLVALADALDRAKAAVIVRGSIPPRVAFLGGYPPLQPEEESRFIGTFEGCWSAFVHNLFSQIGSPPPESIRAMEDKARKIASEAYEAAYRRAIEGSGRA